MPTQRSTCPCTQPLSLSLLCEGMRLPHPHPCRDEPGQVPGSCTTPTSCLLLSRESRATKADTWSRKSRTIAKPEVRAKVLTAGMGVRAPGRCRGESQGMVSAQRSAGKGAAHPQCPQPPWPPRLTEKEADGLRQAAKQHTGGHSAQRAANVGLSPLLGPPRQPLHGDIRASVQSQPWAGSWPVCARGLPVRSRAHQCSLPRPLLRVWPRHMLGALRDSFQHAPGSLNVRPQEKQIN